MEMYSLEETFTTVTVGHASWEFCMAALGGLLPDELGRTCAPGFTNPPSSWLPEGCSCGLVMCTCEYAPYEYATEACKALEKAGVPAAGAAQMAREVVWSSTDPVNGATREFELLDGTSAALVPDPNFDGGWRLLHPSNLKSATWGSATSASSITIEREDCCNTWQVTGKFPVVAIPELPAQFERYEGGYFGCLQDALTNWTRDGAKKISESIVSRLKADPRLAALVDDPVDDEDRLRAIEQLALGITGYRTCAVTRWGVDPLNEKAIVEIGYIISPKYAGMPGSITMLA